MEKKKLLARLTLKKETVMALDPSALSEIYGGNPTDQPEYCTGRYCSQPGTGCSPTHADVSCTSDCTCATSSNSCCAAC